VSILARRNLSGDSALAARADGNVTGLQDSPLKVSFEGLPRKLSRFTRFYELQEKAGRTHIRDFAATE
jgi:hypothetical protein